MEAFVTVENLRHCEARFRAAHARGRIAELPADASLRRTLYEVMLEVRSRPGSDGLSLKELNNATLNAALERASVRPSAPAGAPLGAPAGSPSKSAPGDARLRDAAVYGERSVAYATWLPKLSEPRGGSASAEVDRAYAALVDARDPSEKPAPQSQRPPGDELDAPIGEDELQARLARRDALLGVFPGDDGGLDARESAHERLVPDALTLGPGLVGDGEDVDPRAAFVDALTRTGRPSDEPKTPAHHQTDASRDALIIPRPPAAAVEQRYIALHGADRDFALHPSRFAFDVHGQVLQRTLRGVCSVEATCAVVPIESLPQPPLQAKPFYANAYGLPHPFLLLSLGGDLDGAYDGSSDPIRRAFCVLVYQSSYVLPNGRGYAVLRPAQKEVRRFATPLASLRNLSPALRRPNGTLFNNSADAHTIQRLEYDASPASYLYLTVVLDQYFDRNEYCPGDHVRFAGFELEGGEGATADALVGLRALSAFVDRPEGHEVVRLGPPNAQGFHRSFDVLAPGVLDQAAGRVILDEKALAAAQAMSQAEGPATLARPARVMNASLQMTVTLRVETSSSQGDR